MVSNLLSIITVSICLLFMLGGAETDCTKSVCTLDDHSLRFFVLGDFGGQDEPPYTTDIQLAVAARIAEMGTKVNSHFQMELGDNFYTYGVINVHDPRFNETFRYVYNGSAAMNQPWYIIAGNHDHFPILANVSAEVAYSKNESRWKFPSLYYPIQYQLNNGPLIEFVMIDTIVLCGVVGLDAEFPGLPSFIPPDFDASEKQWQWLEQRLQQSQADYLIVAGHYPVYSIAEHGPNFCLRDRLEPMLHKYKVSVYMDGHDHTLQHLLYNKNNWTVNYVVSGAAAKTTSAIKHADEVPQGSSKFHYPPDGNNEKGGFVYAEISAKNAAFSYFTGIGTQKYYFTVAPRK